jgi:signal peptidase I
MRKKEKIKKKKSIYREYLEAFVYAVVLALIIRAFVVQAFKIPSGSMIPTLLIGDHILVNKFIYGIKIPFTDKKLFAFKEPQRGEIIVFKYPGDEERDFIKRVIGLPGETIEIKGKQVFVNGKPLKEPYTIFNEHKVPNGPLSLRSHYGPVKVPLNHLFVMGDNRDNSMDSRVWGFLDERKVKGKAFMIYWSWDRNSHWVRWRRIGKLLH